jgi:hypothetical protein
MTFDEVINSEILNMPFNQTNQVSFRSYVEYNLKTYLELINELDFVELNIPNITAKKEVVAKRQTEFVKGLKETIDLYYNGYPESAFKLFKTTIDKRIVGLKNMLKVEEYVENNNFFRIRKLNDNNHLLPESFFHIPFELRGKVTTQRFSIPGFPSLYLGKTVYICWEELNRPNINEFHSIRLKSTVPITYIDLAPPYFDTNLHQSRYYKYLMTWPLIFLCSIRVKNKDDIFKPEYIIPQLLLQYIRENERIDGIRYWSTHVEQNPTNFRGEFYNLVLPVKENKDKGLCRSLCKKFQTTEIVSWQQLEFALGGFPEIQLQNDKFDKITDAKMEYLELIKGRKHPYSYSAFGKIEKNLLSLPTKKIICT